MIKSSYSVDVLVMLEEDQKFVCWTPQVDEVMADARDAEESMTGIDQGHKHGKGGSKTTLVVTTCKEEYDRATITEASKNVSAILLIVHVWCSSHNCSLKSLLGFEQNDQICALASCKRRSSCMHQHAESPIIKFSVGGFIFDQTHRWMLCTWAGYLLNELWNITKASKGVEFISLFEIRI